MWRVRCVFTAKLVSTLWTLPPRQEKLTLLIVEFQGILTHSSWHSGQDDWMMCQLLRPYCYPGCDLVTNQLEHKGPCIPPRLHKHATCTKWEREGGAEQCQCTYTNRIKCIVLSSWSIYSLQQDFRSKQSRTTMVSRCSSDINMDKIQLQ